MKILSHSFLLILILISAGQPASAQNERKQAVAIKTDSHPLIDGHLNDPQWQLAPPAVDFYQYEPVNGGPAGTKTEVRFLFDDEAIYIGAMMYDSKPDKILKELGFRDSDELNADYIGFEINPFDDGLNGFGFMVSSSGVQVDFKLTEDDTDISWNAVWKSDVAIIDSGWSAEFSIPYSALRFPKVTKNAWGINIWRSVRSTRETFTWNFVDKSIEGSQKQAGLITGLDGIKPPVRLSFNPYVSGYIEKKALETDWRYNLHYGMDLKYGLTESFTLDMTLIPDFGQVQSDDQVFNLTPFEIYYEEKRPFFTEGTELFQKGNVFYTRRVGATPDGFTSVNDSLGEGEFIKENPANTNLINATKLSGRTNKGLGIGVFNAISAETFATVSDSAGNTRKITTQPFSNYNMLVLDQNLKNNSYVSFYNTNVYKGQNYYTANVTGTQFLLFNKSSTYSIYGRFNLSQLYFPESDNELGMHYNLRLSKTKGQFRFTYSHFAESDQYDPNDLGYIQSNNSMSNRLELNYNFYNPFWKLLRMSNSLSTTYKTLYKPNTFTDFSFQGNSWATFRNHLSVGLNFYVKPVDEYDYYEARTPGQPFLIPPEWEAGIFLSPDYRKRFIVDINADYSAVPQLGYSSVLLALEPRLRVSDRLTLKLSGSWNPKNNDYGFVTRTNDNLVQPIIMGRRDIENVENILQVTYIFTNRIALDFRMRHYWLKADYLQFYKLEGDGTLDPTDYTAEHDFEVNIFNIDMILRWEFAPGSELAFAWKNAIQTYLVGTDYGDYFGNLNRTIDSPADNSLSLRLLYYLDYLYLKKNKY